MTMSYLYIPEFKVDSRGFAYPYLREHEVRQPTDNPEKGLSQRLLATVLSAALAYFPVSFTSAGPVESQPSGSQTTAGPITPRQPPVHTPDTIDKSADSPFETPRDPSMVVTPDQYPLISQPNGQQVLLYGSGDPLWRKLIPDALFSSITSSSGSGDFLADVEASERAQASEISSLFGVGPIEINDFRREARDGKLWTPGFGALWDLGDHWEGIFELSYGKGHLDTHAHFDETHVLGLPFNTGTLDADLRIKRESLGAGLGFNLYPLGKEGWANPYGIFVIGPQYMHFSADGKIDFSGTDAPFPIPSSRTVIRQRGSDLGLYWSFGAGLKLRPPNRWRWMRDHLSVDATARFNQYDSLSGVSRKFDQWTWGIAFVYELGSGKDHSSSRASIEGNANP